MVQKGCFCYKHFIHYLCMRPFLPNLILRSDYHKKSRFLSVYFSRHRNSSRSNDLLQKTACHQICWFYSCTSTAPCNTDLSWKMGTYHSIVSMCSSHFFCKRCKRSCKNYYRNNVSSVVYPCGFSLLYFYILPFLSVY